jgi:hypothetical protein
MSHIQTPADDPLTPAGKQPASAQTPSKPRSPRAGRCRHQPLRDEHGELRAIIEIAPTATIEQRARFQSLARTLYQLWFIDQPSPLSCYSGAKIITAAHAINSTKSIYSSHSINLHKRQEIA